MADGQLASTLDRLEKADAELVRQAVGVLETNSLGHATKPSPRLYPHQWSWDSACIALGYARVDQARAERELRSLFAAQWSNGLLPHIVFTDGALYFPGPEFWQTERSRDAPSSPRTSGIVQPPVHATAALQVYRHAADRERATEFLRELLPKLAAWHGYLYRERTRGDGLAEVWHPWESGMDNSPLWDEALARIVLARDDVPEYQRVDVRITDAAERPSDAEYDRYAYLVGLFRERDYRADEIRDACPFVIQPVLFNSVLVQANRDLAEIARVVGEDPEPFEAWADETAAALESRLWDDELELYLDYDVRAGEHIRIRSATGFAPLYAGIPSAERARQLVARLPAAGARIGDGGWALTSLPPDDPRFEPTLYWRGPIWPIQNWVLYRGLIRYGYTDLAERVRSTLVELSRESGFWEHYNPENGRGHGGEEFSWTAGLVLDLLFSRPEQDGDLLSTNAARTTGAERNTERS